MSEPVYFAQLTDIHVGNNNLNPEAARRNLRVALEEIAAWPVDCRAVAVTADLVCSGRKDELREYCELTAGTALPLYALPANHDLWGEEDAAAWHDLIGAERHVVDMDDLRLVLLQDIRRRPDGDGWHAFLPPEELAWLDEKLGEHAGPAVVGWHAPILAEGADFHDNWRGSNASEVLALLRKHGVLALISGHWHRFGEWEVEGVRVINSGALCGWQWVGFPPYYSFPLRSGYTMYCYRGGRLDCSWRELFSQEMRPGLQVSLVRAGPAHFGGPRPQVRPAHICLPVEIEAHTWSLEQPAERVEWRCPGGSWQPMKRVEAGLWDIWRAVFDPREVGAGSRVLAVRARVGDRVLAYDAAPVEVAEADSPPLAAAVAGRERVFELFYPPE